MKAIVCKEFGPLDDLVLDDVPDPVAGKGKIVIRVEAAGVNYPDGLLVQGLYQMKPDRPFTPGMEIAGTVEAVGEGVSGFAVGDRVAGKGGLGGYAEMVAMPASQCFAMPEGMDGADAGGQAVQQVREQHPVGLRRVEQG